MKETVVAKESNRRLSTDFLLAFILLLIAAILRYAHYIEVGLFHDELAAFAAYAYSTISNNWLWSKDAMAQPPLYTYILAISTYFFGGGLEIFRLVSIVFGSLSVWVIYFLGKELFDRRVGVLSAVLLGFSGFNILYSKIVLIEATLIFFMLACIYYFFKSYNTKDDIKYACICGTLLGLANITKWNALLLYPVFFLFVLWTKRNIRSLFEKKFLLIAIISVLIQLPVWFYFLEQGMNPIFYQLQGRFVTEKATLSTYQQSFGIGDVIIKGFNKFIFVLINEPAPATVYLPWFSIFKLVSYFLVIICILYYFYPVLNIRLSETLIFLYFIVFYTFVALYGSKFEHYLLWGLPAFYIMLSDISFKFFDYIKNKKGLLSISNIVKILTLTFVGIFVFSYILTGLIGAIPPFVDKGELSGYETQISKIKNGITSEDTIATSAYTSTNYYLNRYNLNPHVLSLYFEKDIDFKMLKEVKPRYIIVSDFYYYSTITDVYAKMLIRENYNLISNEEGVLLFERKQDVNNNDSDDNQEKSPDYEISGEINADIFSRSIPAQMTVGRPYDILVRVKNTGEKSTTFVITIDVPSDFIYTSRKNWEIITLNEGGSRQFKFTILPIKQHVGKLNIIANFSLIKSSHYLPSSFVELDNVSTSVLLIKNAISSTDIIIIFVLFFTICFIVIIMKN